MVVKVRFKQLTPSKRAWNRRRRRRRRIFSYSYITATAAQQHSSTAAEKTRTKKERRKGTDDNNIIATQKSIIVYPSRDVVADFTQTTTTSNSNSAPTHRVWSFLTKASKHQRRKIYTYRLHVQVYYATVNDILYCSTTCVKLRVCHVYMYVHVYTHHIIIIIISKQIINN